MLSATRRNLASRFNLKPGDKILDVGGSGGQIAEFQVDTLIDIVPPSFYQAAMPATLQPEAQLNAKNFVQLDLGRDRFPFADNYFDFAICSHTIEDLFDPRLALSEMGRVAKRGLVVTPARGLEMVYSSFDITDWNTGGARVPGQSHHHWFCEIRDGVFRLIPKHYPLLYTPEFHVNQWRGDTECEYAWEDELRFQFWDSVNFRDLLADYRRFMHDHRALIRKKRALFWVDGPRQLLKAHWRRLRRIGFSYELKKIA